MNVSKDHVSIQWDSTMITEIIDFSIEDINALPPVPENVRAVAASVQPSTQMWAVYAASALLLVFEFLRLHFGKSKMQSEDLKSV